MSHVEDRWHTETETPDGKRAKSRTARYGKGLRWRVRYLDPDGKERNKSFRTREEAESFRDNTAADVRRGTYIDPDSGKVTLRDFAESWLAMQDIQASTRESAEFRLRRHIYPVLGGHTLAQLAGRPSLVQSWLAGLSLSPASARIMFNTLSTIMNAAVADELITRNPCQAKNVRRPRASASRVDPWEREQVAAVRAALPERYRILADLGAGLGLRQGEIFGLAATDVEWLRKGGPVVHVRRQVRIVGGKLVFALPKGGKERVIPLPESVRLALAEHLAAHPARPVTLPWLEPGGRAVTAELIMTTPAGSAVNRNTFNVYAWRPAVQAAGLASGKGNGTHALRHHFASVLLHAGVSIKAVSEYLGHSSPVITLQIYAHTLPSAHDMMRDAIDAAQLQDHGPATSQAGAQ